MAPRFNRDKPFGEIHPAYNGAVFEQNGNCFDANGNFMFRHATAEPEEGAGSAAPQLSLLQQVAVMSPAEKAALMAALGLSPMMTAPAPAVAQKDDPNADIPADEQQESRIDTGGPIAEGALAKPHGGPAEIVQPTDGEERTDISEDDVDLVKWLKREENYPFFSVRGAVNKLYPGVLTKDTASIVAGLIEVGVLTADQVKRG